VKGLTRVWAISASLCLSLYLCISVSSHPSLAHSLSLLSLCLSPSSYFSPSFSPDFSRIAPRGWRQLAVVWGAVFAVGSAVVRVKLGFDFLEVADIVPRLAIKDAG
jgi:hypothetical protein